MIAAAAMTSVAVALLLFVAVGVVLLMALWLLLSSSAQASVIARRGGAELAPSRTLEQWADDRLAGTRRGAELGARLRSAGLEFGPARFCALAVAAAVVAGLLVSFVFPTVLAIAAALLAGWACFAQISYRLEKRKEEFVAQLPEVARLLANGASAGLSLPAALELVVREVQRPASEELQTVIDQLTFGSSLDDALESLRRRLPSREIGVLLSTLVIQQRAGGDAVQALGDLSRALEERRDTLREVGTLMAGALFASYLVPLLGVGALLLLDSINSHTLDAMTSQPVGIVALVLAALMYAAGMLLIRRTTRIEL